MEDSLTLKRIEDIEREIEELKKDMKGKSPAQLKGLWKGLKVKEEDFEKAEKSLLEVQ